MERTKKVSRYYTSAYCCVPQCRSRMLPKVMRKPSDEKVSFHTFPNEKVAILMDGRKANLRAEWKRRLRIGKTITNSMRVCSRHFKQDDFVLPGVKAEKCRLRKSAYPTLCIPLLSTEQEDKVCRKKTIAEERKARYAKRNKDELLIAEDMLDHLQSDDSPMENEASEHNGSTLIENEISVQENEAAEVLASLADSLQTCLMCEEIGIQVNMDTSQHECNLQSFIHTEAKLRIVTGIPSFNVLKLMVTIFDVMYKSPRQLGLTSESLIILLFTKLKLNLSFSFLAILFNCSATTAKSYFSLTVQVMAEGLKSAIPWPTKTEIMGNMPKCFQSYKNVRIVLDCTEIPIECSSCLHCKIMTYSHYKGTHTLKFLIGISPGGLITFISKAYGGRASDKALFEQSKLIDKLEPYCEDIMVDKGFLIEDLCLKNGIGLIRPPFLKKKLQMSKIDAEKVAEIARARVHVERIIQRLKIFGILGNKKFPIKLAPLIDNIMTIIAATVNLSSPILSDSSFMPM